MIKSKYLSRIEELFSIWVTRLKLNNAQGYFDINRFSEDLTKEILNITYDLNLVNLNRSKLNSVALDLIDENKKIGFQVTSRTDKSKIINTIQKFVPEYGDTITNGVYFFIISTQKPKFSSKEENIYIINQKETVPVYQLDSNQHIKCIVDVLKDVSEDFSKLKKLHEILELKIEQNPVNSAYFHFNKLEIESLSRKVKSFETSLSRIENNLIPQYIKSKKEKYETVKTIIFKNSLQKFYNIYYPIGIKDKYEREIYDGRSAIESLFSFSDFVTIIGDAGSGKSTILKHILLTSIETFFAVPIIIELRKINNYNGNLFDFVAKEFLFGNVDIDDIILHQFLTSGRVLFLLDGYDEIFSKNIDNKVDELEAFVDTYSNNKFVITSRPETGIERFPRFANYYVKSLHKNQIKPFIEKQIEEESLAVNIWKGIKNQLKSNTHFFSNPLLLSLYILKYDYNPSIRLQESSLYKDIFEALFYRHDSVTKKDGFVRERLTNLSLSQFESLLQDLSFLTYFQGIFSFSKEEFEKIHNDLNSFSSVQTSFTDFLHDLNVSIGILIKDSQIYLFPHRSFQEFFVAKFISKSQRKSEIYTYKFVNFHDDSSDSMLNLWQLCFELDQIDFLRFVVLPALENILTELEDLKSSDLFKILFEKYPIKYFYQCLVDFDSNELYLNPYRKVTQYTFLDRVLRFVGEPILKIFNYYFDKEIRQKSEPRLFHFIVGSVDGFMRHAGVDEYQKELQISEIDDANFFNISPIIANGKEIVFETKLGSSSGYLFHELSRIGMMKQLVVWKAKLKSKYLDIKRAIDESDLKHDDFIDFVIGK